MTGTPVRGRSLCERVYSALLLLYPRSFRRRFAQGMRYTFAHQLAEARTRGGGAPVAFCLRSLLHVIAYGLLERLHSLWQAIPRRRSGKFASVPPTQRPVVLPNKTYTAKVIVTMDSLWTDFRLAIRRLRRSPRFTLVVLATLALGIGANSALFSVVHTVLLSPLPFEGSERLVFAWETRQEGSRTSPVSPLNIREWRAADTGLEELAGYRYWPYNVTGGDAPERVTGAQVSPGLLALLRITPHLGREFTPAEEQPDGDRVCLISHGFWRSRLGGNSDLPSLRLILNGESHTVVGVLPDGFTIPGFGPRPILTPLPMDPEDSGFWSNHNARVFGRLADDVTLEGAGAMLDAVATQLQQTYPDWNDGIGARLVPVRNQLVQGARRSLWILFGSVVFLLLIACANIASLLLARAAEAEQEMAVRTALGAHRSRIVRLALSEALVLGVAGGLMGLWVCHLGIDAIQRWAPGNLPRLGEVSVSLPVLGFTLAVSLGTGLLFGLLPALQSARVNIQNMLKEGGRALGMRGRHRTQRLFVVSQVAIAVVLLMGSGLLLRTFGNLLNVDPGFELEGRTALQVTLPQSSYPDGESVTVFLDRLHRRLDAIPGVRASGSSVGLPFQGLMWRQLMTVEGRPAATLPEVPVVDVSIVTPRWLETLGIPPVRGRTLLPSDDEGAPFVALVNEAFVRAHLPEQDPVGQRLRLAAPEHLLPEGQDNENPWYTIVGVVGDVRRWNLATDALPEVFIQQRQHTGLALEFYVVVHTTLPTDAVADPMRKAVLDADPDQPVAWIRSMDSMYSAMVAQPRFNAALVAAFGVTALILALIGVYGMMANAVSARTREIGLRMALGARQQQLLKQVAGKGVLASMVGVGIGLLAAFVLTRLMGRLLFGVEPLDPATFLVVTISVLLVATAAASVPSWRATKLDPTVALREE